MAERFGRLLGTVGIVVACLASLLTFPSCIPWMIAAWLVGHSIARWRGRTAWLSLVCCLVILVVKCVAWSTVLVVMAALMLAAGAAGIWQKGPRESGSRWRWGAVSVTAVWTWWVVVLVDWHAAAHCNRTPRFQPDRPIVCLGDSLSAGETPAGAYAPHLRQLVRVPVLDLSAPGFTTDDVLKQRPAIAAAMPQVVILEIGGNDFVKGRSRRSIEANLEQIVAFVRGIGAEVVLVEIPRGFMTDPLWGVERRLARRYDLELVSDTAIRQLVLWSPHAPPGMWTRGPYLSDDGLHPNSLGARYLAGRVARALARVYGPKVDAAELLPR